MSVETAGIGTLIIIVAMAVVTAITRFGGLFAMSIVPVNRRITRFINAMSGSVLVALIAPTALEGDHGARLALLATALVMLSTKKPLPAIVAGILAAALFRLF